MSLKRLSLGPILLSSSLDKLSLELDYEVAVRLPSRKFETLSINECLRALTSGEVWVSRGSSCRADFSVTLDGEEVDQANNDHIIDLLGKFVAESNIWAQLGLSTLLHPQNSSLQPGSFSLCLNFDQPLSSTAICSRPWSHSTTDIKIPEGLLCAKLEQLKVRLAFRSTVVEIQAPKRVKRSYQNLVTGNGVTKRFESFRSGTESNPPFTKLGSKQIPDLLKTCSDNLYSSIASHAIPLFFQLSSFLNSVPCSTNLPSSSIVRAIPRNTVSKKPRKSRDRSTNTSTEILRGIANGYIEFKDAAVEEARGNEENSFHQFKNHSPPSSMIKISPRKRDTSTLHHDDSVYIPDPTASCKLVSAAMRAMIVGTEIRQRGTKGVKIENHTNTSVISLTSLSPVMFSPGFKKLVAHNSYYIPRIIQMMTSLVHNAQTPSLRQKLAQISEMTTSELADDGTDEEISGSQGSERRLAAVVQARLWSMMQRTIHDPLAARQTINRLSKSEHVTVSKEDDGYDDGYDELLELNDNKNDMENRKTIDDEFQWIMDENCDEEAAFDCILTDDDGKSRDEFDDLLLDEDELLLSDEDRERLEIEFATEEMFFGHYWQLKDEEHFDDLLSSVEGSRFNESLIEERFDTLGEKQAFGDDDMLV